MIISIGTDIVSLERIEALYQKYPKAFCGRLLTVAEGLEFASRNQASSYLAGRWAAKEAIGKALSCGVKWGFREMEVLTQPSGAPQVLLYGKIANLASELGVKHIHLSISHERTLAIAMVVLEK